MAPVESYLVPRYTKDHFAHYMQVCEWYLDISHFKDQLLAFHVDRSKHFNHWLTERQNTIEEHSARDLVAEY